MMFYFIVGLVLSALIVLRVIRNEAGKLDEAEVLALTVLGLVAALIWPLVVVVIVLYLLVSWANHTTGRKLK